MSDETTANPASHDAVFYTGLLGLLASVLVGAAEFSLHFTPSMDYGGPAYEFFLGTSASRLTLGRFLAIFAAPLYFAGYWHLFQRLRPAPAKARLAVLILGIYSFAVGAVWIGSRVHPAILVQALEAATTGEAREQIAALLERAGYYNETILTGLRIGVLGLSVVFAWLVASGRTSYPRWFAALNPILLVFVSFLVYFAAATVGGYLMPVAMKVAYFILFSTSICLMSQEKLPK